MPRLGHAVLAGCGGDGVQHLGLTQHESVMTPDKARTKQRRSRRIRPKDAVIGPDQQRRQGQGSEEFGGKGLIHGEILQLAILRRGCVASCP